MSYSIFGDRLPQKAFQSQEYDEAQDITKFTFRQCSIQNIQTEFYGTILKEKYTRTCTDTHFILQGKYNIAAFLHEA